MEQKNTPQEQEAVETASNSAPQTEEKSQQWSPKKHSIFGKLAFTTALIGGVVAALYAWHLPPFNYDKVYTNNAYVRGQTTLISAKVSGYVKDVFVNDFNQVSLEQPLVKIDDAPYLAKMAQAKANLLGQSASLNQIEQDKRAAEANLNISNATIENAKAQLHRARVEFNRIQQLIKTNSASKRELDQATATLTQAETAIQQARQQQTIAEQKRLSVKTNGEGLTASVESAKAVVNLAQQDVDNTLIKAPVAGKLGEISVKKGQFVTIGSQLMFIVPNSRWVIANVKETDMVNVKIGQPVKLSIDGLDHKQFDGKVAEISPAAASEFSIIKADSGTGNFVKIAQRIPVKIEFLPEQADLDKILAGVSVEVEIDTSSAKQP